MTRVWIAGWIAAATACSSARPPPASRATLRGEVARVGDLSIGGATVAAVAAARGVSAAAALDGLVEDALLAQGARARTLDSQPETRRAIEASLAARILRTVESDARARGPATERERSSIEVVHAVVLRAPVSRWDDAMALASAIAGAVSGAPTPEAFEERARQMPHAGLRVVVERLPPFGADGHTASGGWLDHDFVAAAFALQNAGDQSPLVPTRFGWHVIRLVERVPPLAAAPAEGEPSPAVLELRVRQATQAILRTARARARVAMEGAVDERLAGARVADALDPDAPGRVSSP